MKLLYIDLFCGAGGTSTGVENARYEGRQCAKVIGCVNHDANAIASHAANHPDALHFTEDIRTLELSPLTAHIAEMLGKAAIPQTITVEAEGVSPETFSAAGITKRELYATVAMASLAHAVITTPPVGGGRLRSDWARRVAAQAAELAYYLDEALGEIERNGEPAKDSRR